MDDFDHLDLCVETWESLAPAKRSRQQQTVMDVVATIAAVEGDGLHALWNDREGEMERIVASFRMAGLDDIAQVIMEGAFCAEVLAQGLDDGGHWKFSPEQDARLRQLAGQIEARGPDAREAVLQFLPKRRG